MKKIIHVNMHKIRSNHKNGEREPVLTVKTHKTNEYAHEVVIYDRQGNEVARVVYSPDKPLSCGAKVWISTECEIDLIRHPGATSQTTPCCEVKPQERAKRPAR